MSQEYQFLEYALIAQEQSDFGGQFCYGQSQGPCSTGKIGFGGRLVSGGISPGSESTITIRKSVLDAAFVEGQKISVTYKNGTTRKFKIAADGVMDCLCAWELTLNDPNQNA